MTIRAGLRLPVAVMSAMILVAALALPAAGQGRRGEPGPPGDPGPPALEGEWTVSPTSVVSGQEVDLVFTFKAGSSPSAANAGGLQVSIPAAEPANWTPRRPQTADDEDPGFLDAVNVGCNQDPEIVDPIDVSDSAFSLVNISLQCNADQSFTLTYHDVTAPVVDADTDYDFDARLSGPPGMDPLDLPLVVTVTPLVVNDADGDGVADENDDCPGTPLGEDVDDDGCSESQLDTDNDLVSNADDKCPNTPSAEVGLVDEDGCSPSQLDGDGDGVSDADDECPDTPPGRRVNARGCPITGDSGNGGGGGGGGPITVPTPPETPPETPPITPPAPGRCVDEAPPSNFSDVPAGHMHERSIDCIAWKNITAGTTPRTFSPGRVTTRAQMASFLTRTIREAGVGLPAGRNMFTDDERSVHQHAINQLAAAGVVVGKAPGRFDPGAPIRRDQMATMLVQTYAYIRDEQVEAGRDHFIDDNGNVHEANINAAADLALTFGRTPGRYEPASGTRRDQMAAFITRLLELLG